MTAQHELADEIEKRLVESSLARPTMMLCPSEWGRIIVALRSTPPALQSKHRPATTRDWGTVEILHREIARMSAAAPSGQVDQPEPTAMPAAGVPEGWVLVPDEPTEAMLEAFQDAGYRHLCEGYVAMLSAAPTPPSPKGGDELSSPWTDTAGKPLKLGTAPKCEPAGGADLILDLDARGELESWDGPDEKAIVGALSVQPVQNLHDLPDDPVKALIDASIECYGLDDEWEDDEDVAYPPAGITFGMLRRARDAHAGRDGARNEKERTAPPCDENQRPVTNFVDRAYLQEVADGAYGDNPMVRGLARDRLEGGGR